MTALPTSTCSHVFPWAEVKAAKMGGPDPHCRLCGGSNSSDWPSELDVERAINDTLRAEVAYLRTDLRRTRVVGAATAGLLFLSGLVIALGTVS